MNTTTNRFAKFATAFFGAMLFSTVCIAAAVAPAHNPQAAARIMA